MFRSCGSSSRRQLNRHTVRLRLDTLCLYEVLIYHDDARITYHCHRLRVRRLEYKACNDNLRPGSSGGDSRESFVATAGSAE